MEKLFLFNQGNKKMAEKFGNTTISTSNMISIYNNLSF